MVKMKVMILALGALLLISMVSAQDHICQGGDGDVHGVFINGVCYNCGADQGPGGDGDGVCPITYGADCTVRDIDCVYIPSTFWSSSSDGRTEYAGDTVTVDMLSGGTNLYLVVKETGLSPGEGVTFTVKRDYPLGDIFDQELTTISGTVEDTVDTRVISAFPIRDTSDFIDELAEGGKYYAIATRTSGDPWPSGFDDRTSKLEINLTYGGKMVLTCADYTEEGEDSCNEDSYGVGSRVVTRQDLNFPGCTYTSTGSCSWNSTTCIQKQGAENITEGSEEACEGGRVTAECEYPTEEKYGSCEVGDEFYRVRYVSNNPSECPAFETQPVPCPKTLKLPFFGIYGIAVSLSMIGFIYFLYRRRFIK